jgi:hypothetical protein
MMILIIIINLSAVAGVPMLPLMRKDVGINSWRAKERRGFTLFAYESISFFCNNYILGSSKAIASSFANSKQSLQ